MVGIVFALKGNCWIRERGGYDSHEELRMLVVFAIGFVVGLTG